MINITQDQIMQTWGIDNSDTPLVSIRCITYNHEQYIAQALDGFLMQKTTFPFEVIVHDDASIDNTAEIIKEYELKFPKIIKPIYEKENQYSKKDGSLQKIVNSACKGKYIAFCEGDDYWISQDKLQKQVDFLEKNPSYGLCYTKTKCYLQTKRIFTKEFGKKINGINDLLRNGNSIPTLTVCCRVDIRQRYFNEVSPWNQGWKMGDYPQWIYFSHESKIKFFNSVTTVYRLLDSSASHSTDIEKQFNFEKSRYDIVNYFSNKYKTKCYDKDDAYILFQIYRTKLRSSYNLNYSKLLQENFKKTKFKTIKMFIYFLLSYNESIWNLLFGKSKNIL